jgi:uncharacterized RDD family membrane protein YckC
MKTWGLRLVREDGRPIDVRQAILRFYRGLDRPAAGLAGYAMAGRWGLLLALVNHGWGRHGC